MIRRVILVLLVAVTLFLCFGRHALAYYTVHLTCPTVPAGLAEIPMRLIFLASTCRSVAVGAMAANPLSCNANAVIGIRFNSTTDYACTASDSDSDSTVGIGHVYLNSFGLPLYDTAGNRTPNGGGINRYEMMFYTSTGAATGGCGLSTYFGQSAYACLTANLRGGQWGATIPVDFSISRRREPDVADLTNYLIMGWVFFALIAGLSFGWRVVQRGGSQ